MSDSLQPHGLQHARFPCPSLSPGVCSNSCPLSWWFHPIIWSSVAPFSSCIPSFPASGYFPMNQLFTSGGQTIGASVSASVLPMNIQDSFSLGLTGLASLVAQMVKNLPAIQKALVWSLGEEDPWRKESLSTPVSLPGELDVGHNWATNMLLGTAPKFKHTHTHKTRHVIITYW